MTEQELAEIEKACAEASPAPWAFVEDTSVFREYDRLTDATGQAIASAQVLDYGGDVGLYIDDGAFIARARSWLPALVAEVRRLALHEKRVRAAALEEAAKVAELWESDSATWLAIAKGIRALKEKP